MIIEFALPILILTALAGLLMAWGIGANDVANAMGTSVGSGAITLSTAILIACIFEFSGAFLAGGEVTSTVRKGILDPLLFQDNPDLFVFGMISALLAAGTWLVVATYFGWPVSTTHTIVGGIVGFGILGLSFSAIDWDTMSDIALSWLLSPLISGTISFFIYLSIDKLKSGGLIIADNVLWTGKVVDPNSYDDELTQYLIDFNEMVKNDERVENIILPIRDGLNIIIKN